MLGIPFLIGSFFLLCSAVFYKKKIAEFSLELGRIKELKRMRKEIDSSNVRNIEKKELISQVKSCEEAWISKLRIPLKEIQKRERIYQFLQFSGWGLISIDLIPTIIRSYKY